MVRRKKVARRSKGRSSGGFAKFSPYRVAHALGLTSVVVLLFYTVMVWFSDFSGTVIVNKFPLVFSFNDWTIIIGLIEAYVLSYITGWIFAKIYNGVRE